MEILTGRLCPSFPTSHQASYNWSKLFKAGLLAQCYRQNKVDPCLYIKDNVICVVYVDDTIFYSPSNDAINREISSLKSAGLDLTDKGDTNAFLGIQMSKDKDNIITITQPALIQTIIKLLKLENDSKQYNTPAISLPLQPYKDAQKFNESWNYRSAIGLLTCLDRNTYSDKEYAIHMCACYQSDLRKPHSNAIQRIGRYLLKTKDKGIKFMPSTDINKLECFVDANFASAYSSANNEDLNRVQSCSGCVIMFANCLITWFS
eukprot:12033501-Ditylum_brightwellii.AAC.2